MSRTIATAGVVSLLLATPCFSGLYIGAAGGPEVARFYQKSHVTGSSNGAPVDVNIVGPFNVIASNNLSGTGGFGTIFAGYEWFYNRYYLAAEINGTLSSVEYMLRNDEYIHQNFANTSFTMKSSGGISILPGFFLADHTLLYLRVGYSNARLKIYEGADPSIQNINTNLGGVRYGLGLKQQLAPHWSVRMDYTQVSYSNVHSYTTFPSAGVTKTTEITPTTAQVGFGVLYNFDSPEVYSK